MTPSRLLLAALTALFVRRWRKMIEEWVRTGKRPARAKWNALEAMALILLWWNAFDAASRLNKRATGKVASFPRPRPRGVTALRPAAGMPFKTTVRPGAPTIPATIAANPDLAPVLKAMLPKARKLAREWAKAQKGWMPRIVAQRRAREIPDDIYEKSLNWQMRRMKRDRLAAIATSSEEELLKDPKVGGLFVFREYWTREDSRVRASHALMQGFVAQRTDPIWRFVLPPNGWNERCYTILRTKRESIKLGYMHPDGSPKFDVRWPNTEAHKNYLRGVPYHGNDDAKAVPHELKYPQMKVFPDPGPWMLARDVAG